MIQLVSHDLPESELTAIARACGWSTAPALVQIVVTRGFGPLSIQSCLASPYMGGIEADEGEGEGEIQPGRYFRHHVEQGGMGVTVTTASAYQCEVALCFTSALARRNPHWTAQAAGMERAVHELVANALVHGNLEVPSPRHGMDGFDAYCNALDRALADPARRRRRVEISAAMIGDTLEVAIRDQGPGYQFCRIIEPGEEPEPRQHGLAIAAAVAELTVEDGGRCVIARFHPGGAP